MALPKPTSGTFIQTGIVILAGTGYLLPRQTRASPRRAAARGLAPLPRSARLRGAVANHQEVAALVFLGPTGVCAWCDGTRPFGTRNGRRSLDIIRETRFRTANAAKDFPSVSQPSCGVGISAHPGPALPAGPVPVPCTWSGHGWSAGDDGRVMLAAVVLSGVPWQGTLTCRKHTGTPPRRTRASSSHPHP